MLVYNKVIRIFMHFVKVYLVPEMSRTLVC